MRQQGRFRGVCEMGHEGHENTESIFDSGVSGTFRNFIPYIPQKARRARRCGSLVTIILQKSFRIFMPYMPQEGFWGIKGTKIRNFLTRDLIFKSYATMYPSCPNSRKGISPPLGTRIFTSHGGSP